jgi:prepilin peptidase CpaA
MILELAIMFLFPAVMVLAGAMDIFTMTIPNRIALGLVAGFFALVPFAGFGWDVIALHVATGAAMLVLGIGAFAAGWVGGGDAKLFAGASLWMGPEYIYQFSLVAALFGGVLTLVLLGLRMLPLPDALSRSSWIARLHDAGRGAPYCTALAAAGLIVYPDTSWVQGLV